MRAFSFVRRRLTYPSLGSALLLVAEVQEDLQARAPPFELHLPAQELARSHHDQMGAPDTCGRSEA